MKPLPFVIVCVTSLVDAASTYLAMRTGGVEETSWVLAQVIERGGWLVFFLFKALSAVAALGAVLPVTRFFVQKAAGEPVPRGKTDAGGREQKIFWIAALLMSGAYLAAAFWNLRFVT